MIHPYSHYPARAARHWPTNIALVDGARTMNYAELDRQGSMVAQSLLKIGVKPGDRVAILQRNCIEYVVSAIGIARAGGAIVPLLGALTQAEHDFVLDNSGARVAIALSPEDVPHLIAAGHGEVQVLTFGKTDKAMDMRAFSDVADTPIRVDCPPSQLAQILYTSGTTGKPKGVTHSYASVAAAMNFWAGTFALTPQDRLLGQLALSHFCGRAMDSSWLAGARLVILPEADPEAILRAIDEQNISMMLTVPTSLRMMLDHPNAGNTDFSSLRAVVYAASPAAPSLVKRAGKMMGSVLYTGFGQTEAYGLNTIMGPEEHEAAVLAGGDRLTSVGRECPQAQVSIRSENGEEIAIGEVGEIWICAPWATPGFWKNAKLDAARLTKGWLRTGDLGRVDADGFFYLADRKEDMIITGGFNVYPAEVENVLMEHEAVAECGVYSVPDEKWGEAVNASIVLRDGYEIAPEELLSFAKERLARFKAPKFILIVDELPKTPVGKILRRVLREPFWEGQSRNIHGVK